MYPTTKYSTTENTKAADRTFKSDLLRSVLGALVFSLAPWLLTSGRALYSYESRENQALKRSIMTSLLDPTERNSFV